MIQELKAWLDETYQNEINVTLKVEGAMSALLAVAAKIKELEGAEAIAGQRGPDLQAPEVPQSEGAVESGDRVDAIDSPIFDTAGDVILAGT